MPACHAGGRGFEPHPDRQFASVAQLVEQGTENPRVGGSIPPGGTTLHFCEANVREWLSGRASPCQGERREFESRLPLQDMIKDAYFCVFYHRNLIWRHSQVVRQSSAKALFSSSNLDGASKKSTSSEVLFYMALYDTPFVL